MIPSGSHLANDEVEEAREAAAAFAIGIALRERYSGPPVWHASQIPADLEGHDVIALALDLVARELDPLAVTFSAIAGEQVQWSVVHGSHLPPTELIEEAHTWERRIEDDPLGPDALAHLRRRVATLDDVGGPATILDHLPRRRAYKEIGVLNDVRMLIRDGGRLVACLTLWRPLRSRAWTGSQLRALHALQPLIEMAYQSALRTRSQPVAWLPETLTRRQREVARLLATGASNRDIARALSISAETAKSHTRAVLAKLGVDTRREVALRLAQDASVLASGLAGDSEDAVTRWCQGDAAAAALLEPALEWAGGQLSAAAGGCMLFSRRLEVVGDAVAVDSEAGDHIDPRFARRLHRRLFPRPEIAELIRDWAADPGRSSVIGLQHHAAVDGGGPHGETVAMTKPLGALLQFEGRVAGLLWFTTRGDVDERECLRRLRRLHPLLELAYAGPLAEALPRIAVSGQLERCGLTPKELAVARLALTGRTNTAIAAELGIADSTVRKHVSRILAKCGVRSRTELIALMS